MGSDVGIPRRSLQKLSVGKGFCYSLVDIAGERGEGWAIGPLKVLENQCTEIKMTMYPYWYGCRTLTEEECQIADTLLS